MLAWQGSSPSHEQAQTCPVAQSRSDWHAAGVGSAGLAAADGGGAGVYCELGADEPQPPKTHAATAAVMTPR